MTERVTYRGWEIHQGRWPEPAWMATGPNYDAWTEGEGEWVDNGHRADAPTREALIQEIDIWFEENGEDREILGLTQIEFVWRCCAAVQAFARTAFAIFTPHRNGGRNVRR